MKSPIIIETIDVSNSFDTVERLLKPKAAPAIRITERQKMMIEAYKLFQEKYVAK